MFLTRTCCCLVSVVLARRSTHFQINSMRWLTIVYPQITTTGNPPTFWQLVSGRIPEIRVRAQLREIPDHLRGKNFRTDREFRADLEKWINRMWEEKDELINRLNES